MCACVCVCVCVREIRVTIAAGRGNAVKTNHLTKQWLVKHTLIGTQTDTHTHTNTHRNGQSTLNVVRLCANNTGQQSATARDFSSPWGAKSESSNALLFVCCRRNKRIGEMERNGRMRGRRKELCCSGTGSTADVTQNPQHSVRISRKREGHQRECFLATTFISVSCENIVFSAIIQNTKGWHSELHLKASIPLFLCSNYRIKIKITASITSPLLPYPLPYPPSSAVPGLQLSFLSLPFVWRSSHPLPVPEGGKPHAGNFNKESHWSFEKWRHTSVLTAAEIFMRW